MKRRKTRKTNSKKEERIVLIIIILCLIAYFVIKNMTNQERFASAPSEFYDHQLMTGRMTGSCESLTGNVAFTIIFVSDELHPWSAEDIETHKASAVEAIEAMESAAATYGAVLNGTVTFMEVLGNEVYPASSDKEVFSDWVDSTLKKAGLGSARSVTQELKKEYDADEAPIVFMVNERGRSHAKKLTNPEAAVCYRGSDARTFAHEVAHLFGAVDYYSPEALSELAGEYFPVSLMNSSLNPEDFDELTAYLVGWTDSLTSHAQEFLQESEFVDLSKKDKLVTDITGNSQKTVEGESFGTISWSTGIYTGDLYNGWPHGSGTLTITNVYGQEIKYVGEFVNGEIEGYGIYSYADGSSYAGYWKNGKPNGQGEYTSSDGKKSSGVWVDGALQP